MTTFVSLLVGVLLLLLVAVALKGWLASQGAADAGNEDTPAEACPSEFVDRIFSPSDWTYVQTLKSTAMEKMFRKERRAVALAWVEQMSAEVRRIMGEHAKAARQSKNLKPGTELKIFLQFAALRIACGVIWAGIYVAGPPRVGGLAVSVQRLFQQISEAQRAFEPATQ